MADEQSGWKIGAVDVPADAAPANIGGGWTISSAPAEAAVAPAAAVPAPAPTNANAMQPEAGGFAPGPAKPPAVPMQYSQFGKRTDKEFDKEPIPEAFENPVAAASQAIGGGWRLIKAVAPNIGYTQLRGMGKPESELGPPPTTDARPAMNAASDVIEGAGNLVAPVALPLGLAAAPVETGLTLAGMYGASKGASAATEALGGSPEASRFAGDVAGALVAGGGGKLALGKMYEAAGSPEVKFGGTFPEAKAFADMSDQELIGHANSIERDPPKNYAWQKEEIAKEVINRQNARALPGTAGQPPAPPEDLGGGWSLVRAKMAARSADVRGTPAAEPVVTPPDVAPAVTPPESQPVTPETPAAAAPPPALPRELAGAKPRYSYGAKAFTLNFDSDLDKAAYISAQEKPSMADAQYVDFVAQHTGMDDAEIRAAGGVVRSTIKSMARDASPGELTVPSHSHLWETQAPAAAPAPAPPVVTPPDVTPAVTPPESQPVAPETPRTVTPPPEASPEERGPGWVGDIPRSEINIDAPRFQFKQNVGQSGAGDEFRDVTQWDPEKAGILSVWKDPADGKTYVANGHHRMEIAARTTPEDQPMTVRYLDADTAQQARTKGALINIAEGRGEATDAAKVFRDMDMSPEERQAFQQQLGKGKIATQGMALANLAKPIFDDVISGDLTPARGSIIGAGVESHADQLALYDLINKRAKRPTDDQVKELIRLTNEAPKRTETQESLFGAEEMTRSLLPEKAEVSDYVRKQLAAEKKLFGAVANQGAADRLGEAGNVIKAGENAGVAERANQGMALYDKLSGRAGPISLTLDRAAQDLAEGKNATDVKQRAYREIRDGLKAQLDQFAGVQGERVGGAEGLDSQGPLQGGGSGAEKLPRAGPDEGPAESRRQSPVEPATSLPDLLAGAHAQKVPRAGAQLADTLQVNAHAAEVLRQAYERGSGVKIGDVDGMAARPEHAQAMLRGLKGMAAQADLPAPAQQAAARLAAELRKASGSGLRQVAIAVPEAQSHEHVHFAVDRLKFDPEKILAHPETRLAVTEARSRGLVTGSDARAIREVITRITSGERGSVKLGADAANRVVTHFLQNSVHGESELATLEELAHESLKDTIGKAGRGRSPDSGTAGGGGEEPDAPGDYRAQRGRAGGDGGVRAHDGGDTGEEGPELSRVARDESLEAVKEALAKPEDKDFGAKLRTYVTGERDVRIAETNQLRGDLQRMVPNPVDQQAITLMRDFKHRPGELAEFVSGSHEAYAGMDPEERAAAVEAVQKLEPVIDRAQHPTPAMLEADRQMTAYFAAHLKEGKALGFLDSKWDNDEYITHIGMGGAQDAAAPGLAQRLFDFARGGGKAGVGPRGFKFAQKRDIPTVLHGVAYGRPPRTLNALDAMTIYGDQFARTAAAHLMMNALGESGVSKWGTFRGQKTGKIPADWVEMAPDSPLFRKEISFKGADDQPEAAHHQLFVPPKVADALAPIFTRNGMDLVPGWKTARLYQAYIKSVELGMSVFHVKALNLTGLNNMGPEGVLKAYQTDMQSPAFEAQERVMVRAGGETPILGRTMEAYHALTPTALPTGPDVLRGLPVIRQVDHVAQAISEFTFGVVQRKLKVTDFSLKDAAWLAKHPDATGAEHFEAQRNIARQVNATYGGLHWENLGVHRTGLELSRALLLAPDWTYSNILNVGQSFEGGPAGSASRLFWLRSALVGVALTEGMSLLMGGKASKDPTQVNMGKDRNGGDVHQNMFFAGAPGDATTLVNNVEKYGGVYGLARSIFNKFGPIAKTAVDLHDTRVAKADTSVLDKTWTGTKRAGEDLAPVPFAIPSIARMLRDQRGIYSMQDYVSTALTGQTPTHDAPPKPSPEMRRLMGRKPK